MDNTQHTDGEHEVMRGKRDPDERTLNTIVGGSPCNRSLLHKQCAIVDGFHVPVVRLVTYVEYSIRRCGISL